MTKDILYSELTEELDSLLSEVHDAVTAMASVSCVLYHRLERASWVGFYRVVSPRRLRIGPYQGPLGCLEIDFSRGVCGSAASEQETQLVDDVHDFPGHIACDASARSEIVVPVFTPDGRLFSVLDVDSRDLAAFDLEDQRGLERLVRKLSAPLTECALS